jgi:hypothetical protein
MAAVTTLPAAFVSGNVLTAAQLNDLRGAFRVLQVVVGTYAVQTISTTSAMADTGLTATITPSSASSKVLVIVQQGGVGKLVGNALSRMQMKLFRGATDLGFFADSIGFTNSSIDNYIGTQGHIRLDEPATTSATTYKTQFANQFAGNGVLVQANTSASSILLMEISA